MPPLPNDRKVITGPALERHLLLLHSRIDNLTRELRTYKSANRSPTVPIYDPELPAAEDSVDAQFAVTSAPPPHVQPTKTPVYFDAADQKWHRFGSPPAFSRYSNEILNDPAGGLVLYWKLDEIGNTTTKVVDWSGNGHDGVFYGGPNLGDPGLADQTAVAFDGSDDMAAIVTHVPGIQANGRMSIEFWFDTSSVTPGGLVCSDDGASDGRFFKVQLNSDGTLRFAIFDIGANGYSVDSATVVNDGERHYCVCTFDGTDMSIFIDEPTTADATSTPAMTGGALADHNDGFYVGSGSWAAGVVGGHLIDDPVQATLDEVALYTVALPTESRVTHWLAGQAWFIASGAVEWFIGAGAPSSGLGVDSDLYLNDSNEDVYLKVAGTWGLIGNIAGGGGSPTGSAGGALDGSFPNPGIAASVAGAGLAEASDVLSVNVDGSTLEINSDTLRMKDTGPGATGPIGDGTHVAVVTINAKGQVTALSSALITGAAPSGAAGGALDGSFPNPGIAASVAGAGLAEASDVLSVNVDGSTLEINSDTLRMKDTGPGATGPLGDSSHVVAVTINAKGQVTALSSVAIDSAALVAAPGSDLTATGQKIDLTAGETLAFGDPVYIKSDGKVWKGDADTATTYPAVGIALGSAAANATVTVLLFGIARNDAWSWTVGGIVYLSTSSGLTQTQPSATDNAIQVIGIAPHADRLFVNPQLIYITHT